MDFPFILIKPPLYQSSFLGRTALISGVSDEKTVENYMNYFYV